MLIEDRHGLFALLEYNPSLYRLKIQIRLATNEYVALILSKFVDFNTLRRYDSDNVQLLWENVDSLISGWYAEMLKTKDVACVHCLKERSYDPFLFSMDELELTVAAGKQYVYCRGIHPVRIGARPPASSCSTIEEHAHAGHSTENARRTFPSVTLATLTRTRYAGVGGGACGY